MLALKLIDNLQISIEKNLTTATKKKWLLYNGT